MTTDIKMAYDYMSEIAYTLTDKNFPGGKFDVYKTANGWWIEKHKVQDLIQAFKIDCTVEEACAYAGISVGSFRRFLERHPDFGQVIQACRDLLVVAARKNIADLILVGKSSGDKDMSLEFMRSKRRAEYGPKFNPAMVIVPVTEVKEVLVVEYPNGEPAQLQSVPSLLGEQGGSGTHSSESGGQSKHQDVLTSPAVREEAPTGGAE